MFIITIKSLLLKNKFYSDDNFVTEYNSKLKMIVTIKRYETCDIVK